MQKEKSKLNLYIKNKGGKEFGYKLFRKQLFNISW